MKKDFFTEWQEAYENTKEGSARREALEMIRSFVINGDWSKRKSITEVSRYTIQFGRGEAEKQFPLSKERVAKLLTSASGIMRRYVGEDTIRIILTGDEAEVREFADLLALLEEEEEVQFLFPGMMELINREVEYNKGSNSNYLPEELEPEIDFLAECSLPVFRSRLASVDMDRLHYVKEALSHPSKFEDIMINHNVRCRIFHKAFFVNRGGVEDEKN